MGGLDRSVIYRGFHKTLTAQYGTEKANAIWKDANNNLRDLKQTYPDITGDNKMMILPSAALYLSLEKHIPDDAITLLCTYGTHMGKKIAGIVHSITSIPGVSQLLWKNMPGLMRKMSSPEMGYTRRIVSETSELVGVDILSCPLHNAAVRIGIPQAALVVCAMDKAYMTGFKYIRYTRTLSVAEGADCCDYRLSYDKYKK